MTDDRKAARVPRSRFTTYQRCRIVPARVPGASHPAEPEPELEIEVLDRRGGSLTAAVSGEIDLGTAQALRDRLAELAGDARLLVLDFAGVRFCDATGLGSLVAVRNDLAGRGGRLRLAAVRPAQRRLLLITGLDRLIPLYGTVAEAGAGGRTSSRS